MDKSRINDFLFIQLAIFSCIIKTKLLINILSQKPTVEYFLVQAELGFQAHS